MSRLTAQKAMIAERVALASVAHDLRRVAEGRDGEARDPRPGSNAGQVISVQKPTGNRFRSQANNRLRNRRNRSRLSRSRFNPNNIEEGKDIEMFAYKLQRSKNGRGIALRALAAVLLLSPFAFGICASAQPAGVRPPVLNVGIDQLLNNQVPLDLEFRDERADGQVGGVFQRQAGRVVAGLLRLPAPLHAGADRAARRAEGAADDSGQGFVNLSVSFDPRETPQLAAAKKAEYLKRYDRPGAEAGWHFLTGDRRPSRP